MSRREEGRVGVLLLSALLLAVVGLPVLGQNGTGDVSLRTTTRVVNVSVVVTDANGQPVKYLNEDDFTILDDGHPQRITFFSPIDNSVLVSNAFLPGPNTYTNSAESKDDHPNVTILLFDTLNSRWTSQGYGLNRVRDFLRQIRPDDRVGVYVLGDHLIAVHPFNRDASDVIDAMHRYDHRHDAPATRRAVELRERPSDKALDRFLSGKDNRYRFERSGGMAPGRTGYAADKLAFASQMTTASLDAIARELSAVSGRKTLIWVTDSIGPMGYFMAGDIDPILKGWSGQADADLPAIPSWQNGTDVEQMIRLMNNAGIAVYTVDARGLETERLGFRRNAAALPTDSPTDPVLDLLARTPEPNGELIELAQRTGGRAFRNRNDLETGLRRALDDSRFTYAIAYAPDHNKWKGEWRKIQVKVDRPGITVLARSGYFALPEPRPIPPKDRLRFLSEIAAGPIDSSQLPLVVHISAPPKARPGEILATVDVPPQSLATLLAPEANGHIRAHFEIMFMQIDAKHKLLVATQKQVDGELMPREYAATSKGGWTLPVHLAIKPGAQLLCVILHDEASDQVGSVRIPLSTYMGVPNQR